jgi:hypothetical protein
MKENYSSMVEKNSPDIQWLMFYSMMADALSFITYVSGRMDHMTQFIS